MNKQIIGAAIFGMIMIFIIVIGFNKVIPYNTTDTTPNIQTQEITSSTNKKTKVTLIGTYAIKKLDIEDGSIYFTDGWAVFVPGD